MKSLLKQIVPPLLLQPYYYFVARYSAPIEKDDPWREFASFDHAAEASRQLYDDARLTDFRVRRIRNYSRSNEHDPVSVGNLCLLTAVQSVSQGRPLSIVDFGGFCGEASLLLSRMSCMVCSYTVVEINEIVARLQDDPIFSGVTFVTALPDDGSDIFYTSGALQYLKDPYGVLEHAFATTRERIILARNSFTRGREIFRVQESNLYDNSRGDIPEGFENDPVSYPHRTLDINKVYALADRHGWRVLFTAEDNSGVYGPDGEVFGFNIVFSLGK